MRLRMCRIALPERIVGVLQFGVPRDPILCRTLGGEARGGWDQGTHLTKHNAKTPVALNEDLICCFGHCSDMGSHPPSGPPSLTVKSYCGSPDCPY